MKPKTMNTRKKRSIKKLESQTKYTKEESIIMGIESDEDIVYNEYDDYDEEQNEEDEEDEEDEEEDAEYEEKQYSASDYDKKVKKKKADKEKYYVDPKEFDNQITLYYNSNNLTNELAEMVAKIAHKLSYAPNFINYSYREEMVGDGVIRMFKALMSKKYCHDKGTNPFSYFTRIAFNAFRNRIKKEKYIHETHEKYRNEFLMLAQPHNSTAFKNGNSKKRKDQ